ncbi:MAG: hypothetical protein J0M12_11840 [Deltaproteobacteria bacterium]|nr:hypothetical protein [Deltaproteobacteria bacterium]
MIKLEPPLHAPIARLCGVNTPPEAVVIASSRQIDEVIRSLAVSIQPWIDTQSESPVLLVALLEGGRFYADRLSEALKPICSSPFERMDIKVSTRDGDGRPLESPEIRGDLSLIQGRRVLIVDDILDSGITLRLTKECFDPLVQELRSTVLIQKDPPNASGNADPLRPTADYVGLSFIDSRWFSGAGMDMPGDPEGRARNAALVIAYPPVF